MNIIDRGQVEFKNEVLLCEVDVTNRFDFLDGYQQVVKVEYTSQEEFLVYLYEAGN